MNTIIWGNSAWQFLHIHSLLFKPTSGKSNNLYDFYSNLNKILPCKYCRINYKEHNDNGIPTIIFSNNNNYQHWLYNLHNKVNQKLREQKLKIIPDPQYNDVIDYYTHLYKNYKKENVFIGFDFINSIFFNLQKTYTTERNDVIFFLEKLKYILPDFKIQIMTDFVGSIDKIINMLNTINNYDDFINQYFNEIIICAKKCSKKCDIEKYNITDFINFYQNQRAKCSKTKKTCRK